MGTTETEYSELLKILASNLKKARERKALRQAEMVKYGFSERYIQKVESGRYSPNLYTVHRLAEAYEVPVSDLFKP